MPHPNTQPSPHDTYTSPLAARNASPEMCRIWSPRHKFQTWRKIWLAVAEAQYEVTKDWDKPLVTMEQIEELRANLDVTDDDLALAAKYEAELRHDVMAHVHAWGDRCPKARPIIHLGMTSQDVVCNADLLILHTSIELIELKAVNVILSFGERARDVLGLPTLGFTHYQTAQPTTIGRRLVMAAHELLLAMDPFHLDPDPDMIGMGSTKMRGFRGATGTQASFVALLGGDYELVDTFEALALSKLREGDVFNSGFQKAITEDGIRSEEARRRTLLQKRQTFELTGQTYPRIVDAQILANLASVAAVLHKIATDIRLLSNRKEIDEPFGKNQIGSSAMPYKRNPMKCERICGLTRFVMNLVGNAYDTAATQWLERTLDDSSNRRLSLPEAFLALDGALDLMHQVASGLVVNEAMVRKNLMAELPFLATENIMMEAVKTGGDRQDLHEKIRVHAQAAGHRVKQEGLDNNLIERLKADPAFKSVHHLLTEDQLLDPMKYVGRSVEQTERFLKEVVEPLRERYGEELDKLGSSDRGV
ncbi:MAG: adenylosuccinate lyase [Phycisphaerales bacterium JB058]